MWIDGLEGQYSVMSDGNVYNHNQNRVKKTYNGRVVIRGKIYYIKNKVKKLQQENNIDLIDILLGV